MERESNQLEAGPILCRTGCGFFGSSNTDGLCSKCYKDLLKKKQQPPSTAVTSPSSNSSSCGGSPSPTPPPPTSIVSAPSIAVSVATNTAQPTVPSLSQSINDSLNDKGNDSGVEATSLADSESSSSPESDAAKKKKNKCQTCKKKVGLTGFTCRCGGLFCSVHRYSNEHRCTFDYRELGAEEIRRNNPVVKGEKIQKI